ncbi:charged multivesicular body protein 2a isoform X2 [Phacochoerus africanus]|uniref:charged multivesicular body protein 2a isoform X2 n=1 Tax=Phacochoerus africanus TaxID=41426 RepID=UPI001FD96E0B|nr:charged multivesicular body protein 2a isoform X2 [Phacochoerus africanus]
MTSGSPGGRRRRCTNPAGTRTPTMARLPQARLQPETPDLLRRRGRWCACAGGGGGGRSPVRAHARCCPLPAFRVPAKRVTSSGLIRKRRRRQRRQNRGAVVGGRSREPSQRSVTRKRKRTPVPAPRDLPQAHRWAPAAMDLLFGRRKTPEELLRQNQRALNRAMRELDRERQKLETQEKKIIADIKKMAKQGQMLKLPQIQKIMMEFERQAEIMDMKEEMMNDAIDDAMGDEEDEEESDAVVAQVLDELGLSLTDELSNLPSTGGSLSVAASGKKAEAAASALVDADADLEERLKNLRRD